MTVILNDPKFFGAAVAVLGSFCSSVSTTHNPSKGFMTDGGSKRGKNRNKDLGWELRRDSDKTLFLGLE